MNNTKIGRRSRVLLAAGCVLFGLPGQLSGAETNSAPVANAPTATQDTALAEQNLRAYLKLQEQLHATLLAVEQARLESSAETKTSAEAVAARLELLEKSLSMQRDQQLQAVQESNRTLIVLAGGLVGLGLLALAFTALFQSRGMNRLAEIATHLSPERALLAAQTPLVLGAGDKLLLGSGSAASATGPLLATIEHLESRIHELEHTAYSRAEQTAESHSNGKRKPPPSATTNSPSAPPDHVALLLGKGQVLLSVGKAAEAIACFDEAAIEAPDNAEAHVKKGLALERLKRLDEAIECYDRAIALNRSLTRAYLAKGSVFSQQERYSEALECYEQALRVETKG